jgi:type 1 glutamine amidotransferase
MRVILWGVLLVLALFAVSLALNWDRIQRTMLGGVHVYETTPPALPAEIARPAILVFSKTNGFRHEEAIPAANAMLTQMAKDNGWGHFQTENGATFDPAILSRFDAVVFNNVSGDVFTPAQRQALKGFIESGGGFVGIHGAGGDPSYDWRWYVEDLIGAQFKGHPMNPQFQQATVRVEDKNHPATRALPATWSRIDEWYSFEKAPRRPGYHVLLTLDERSFANHKMFGKDLAMGADHPIAWWHCVGQGPVFYSAIGHQASAYAEPKYRAMLLGAIKWALGQEGPSCAAPPPQASPSGKQGQ